MSEYVAKQQEIASNRRQVLEEEARRQWGRENLESVCVPWLMEGREVPGHGGGAIGNVVGCSGGCSKSHPRITLSFDGEKNCCYASISHRLDPFINYFSKLCQEGLASKEANATATKLQLQTSGGDAQVNYNLKGYLERHLAMLRQHLPNHLVDVSPRDLAASRRAHEKHQFEEDERRERTKRLKLMASANGKSKTKNGTCSDVDSRLRSNSVLDDVLQICFEHGSLTSHLTMAEISWMRLCGNRSLANAAARLAGQRMRSARLTYSVLVMPRNPEIKPNNRIPKLDEGSIKLQEFLSTSLIQEYIVAGSHRSLTASDIKNPCLFTPLESNVFRCSNSNNWSTTNNSSTINRNNDPRQQPEALRDRVLVRLYLEDLSFDSTVKFPERDCLAGRTMPIEFMRFQIDAIQDKAEGTHNSPCNKLTYKLLKRGPEIDISVESINVGFEDLLGIYARKKLPIAKKDMQNIRNKRPLKRSEKECVKEIAKLAREMPRSNEPFLKGW